MPATAEPINQRLRDEIAQSSLTHPPVPDEPGVVGRTTFDAAGSADGALTVLLSMDRLRHAAAQALVRIESRADGRRYLGVVTAGPFAEPDSLKAESPVLKAVAIKGGNYLPPYHGRVEVTLLGELQEDGTLAPPRLRPLPHSPVFLLSDAEAATVLRATGDIRLGLAAGYDNLPVCVPSDVKAVLPRHTAILGTTGGGKSTTVAGLVREAQAAGMAVILLDVEGEYTCLHEPAGDARSAAARKERGLPDAPLPADRMTVYHLAGRDPTNPKHPHLREFTLQFARLSPYAAMEILGLSEAQQERFLKAFDVAKEVMRELHIFPVKGNTEQERMALEIDEFERGYPRLTLPMFIDVVAACLARAEKPASDKKKGVCDDEAGPAFTPHSPEFNADAARQAIVKRVHSMQVPGNAVSWRALIGRLGRLNRLKVFFDERGGVKPIDYARLLRPGHVSVIDLADSGFSELNNIVIADLLHGLQEKQDELYQEFDRAKREGKDAPPPPRVLLIIEEAHEFLSEERVEKTRTLFEQVARIAKRGRKRWLGLTFVTQLPQHLPRQLLGLVNSFVLHKITDPQTVTSLRRAVGGIDEGLWSRLPALAPGQAIVSFPHLTRPLLVSIDPTPCRLRMWD